MNEPLPAGLENAIICPALCKKHQALLVHQAGYLESDPWRALILSAQIALFQAMTADPKAHAAVGGNVKEFRSLGCSACYKPDKFGEIVEAAKRPQDGIRSIKLLGERWIEEAKKPEGDAT